MKTIQIDKLKIGPKQALTIIAGPCVAESRELCLKVAATMRKACDAAGVGYIFKASYDKANRSSLSSARGPGMDEALRWLEQVREKIGVPVTTDIHESHHAAAAGQVVDVLQIPAFLCRQTDLLAAAAKTGRAVNVKKGQFLSPAEMTNVVTKLTGAGAKRIILTERGTFFGYNRLVNDFIGLGDLLTLGWPVCFDVTHSTQEPGGGSGGTTSGGRPEHAPLLARCAVAAGVQALFIETHPDPARGLSDAATMLPLDVAKKLVKDLAALHEVTVRLCER